MVENKQINQEIEEETIKYKEDVPLVRKGFVDILDLLEAASSWLV